MTPVKRYEVVEVIVQANAGGTFFKISDQPNLRMDSTQDIVIVGLEMFSVSAIPISPLSQAALATDAQLQNTSLVLYVDDEESIHLIPAVKLQSTRTALATSTLIFQPEPLQVKNLVKVNWDKSFYQAHQPYNTGGANAQFSLYLGVSYLKLEPGAWGKLTAGQIQGL